MFQLLRGDRILPFDTASTHSAYPLPYNSPMHDTALFFYDRVVSRTFFFSRKIARHDRSLRYFTRPQTSTPTGFPISRVHLETPPSKSAKTVHVIVVDLGESPRHVPSMNERTNRPACRMWVAFSLVSVVSAN